VRYDERPLDHSPLHTEDLPPTPVRDRNIPATAWIEAPASLQALAPVAEYKRRIGPWLLWRSGPATGDHATYVAVDASDLDRQHTFHLLPDGTGAGEGPSGAQHVRFRSWKEDLLGKSNPPG
jgi:hypothetical protein